LKEYLIKFAEISIGQSQQTKSMHSKLILRS
jgi:hypothetical protein